MQRRVPDDVGEHDRGEAAFGGHELEEPGAAERITAPPAMASCVRPRSAAEGQVEVPAAAASGSTQYSTIVLDGTKRGAHLYGDSEATPRNGG